MSVLVKDSGIRVLHRHIEQDKTAVRPTLEQSGEFRWFAVPKRRELAELFGIAKGHNLQRNWNIDVCSGHQSGEDAAHLFETHGHFAATLLAGIGDHGEVRRTDLDPLWPISVECGRND